MTPIGVGVGIEITSAMTQNTTPYMVTVGVLQVIIMYLGHIRGQGYLFPLIFVTETSNDFKYSINCIQGFAAGTLLYVCVFEIIEREKYKQKVPGLVQLLCVILGFSSLMLVEILGML